MIVCRRRQVTLPTHGMGYCEAFVTGDYADKGNLLLCKTSNPGSEELLALNLTSERNCLRTVQVWLELNESIGWRILRFWD
jgi:hypothetical protein